MAYGRKLSFGRDYIIPTPFDPRLIYVIPPAVAKAGMDTGCARRPIVDLEALGKLPEHTLGGALSRFVLGNQLNPGLYQVPTKYIQGTQESFLMQRIRHSHDVWHVLMDFTPEGHEEILLHAFSLAQTGLPSSAVLMALGSMKHMLLEARMGCLLFGMTEAYARGRRAASLLDVYWEQHWHTPVSELRERYRIEPWTARDRHSTRPWSWQAPTQPVTAMTA